MQWVKERERWITPMELMVAQGFPVLDQTDVVFNSLEESRMHLNVCSFHRNNNADRSRSALVKQSGNTMHVHVVGCIIAVCLGWADTVMTNSFFAR
eukprot:2912476-Pyramimonas_sp.AAC.1